ncbi:DUF1700 domain-containing protein [Romboutsia sp. 1001713B170131_170501_G6]|uniref:DUF1700 domain-containing protein n=1 Tax=Romboutsia sp. 1001713B170131_170501_G6 TaxID=2787108 RepID=UPI0018A989FB
MNKDEFLKILRKKLKSLPQKEIDDALMYYEEYFDEAGIDSDHDVLCELSHPSDIASQILSEYAVKEINSKTKSIKTGISSLWFILLAIIVSPIAFPIAFPILITIVVGIFVSLVLGFVFFIVTGSLVFSGVVVLLSGFKYLFVDIATSLISIGTGSLLIGISILGIIVSISLFIKISKLIVSGCSLLLDKIKNR